MLYQEASRILDDIGAKKASVKSLVLNSKFQNTKQLFALVCESLKYQSVLDSVLDTSGLMKQERCLKSQNLARVLIYDFLIGKGISAAPKNLKEAVHKHKTTLRAQLARLKVKAGVTKNQELLSDDIKNQVQLPRYVRVNTLKTTLEDVIRHFRSEGYNFVPTQGIDYKRFVDLVGSLQPKQAVKDLHVPGLLVFSPGTDLHDHVLYTRGDIILQDKASCLPAHVLSPLPGSHVIDSCAAPGNKTTHAASYLRNKGKIFSFDLDVRRLATMGTLTLKAGVLCAELINQDFLKADPMDPKFAKVKYILVDPSCSGSGIVSRLNTVTDDKDSTSESRLESLSSFQTTILAHALTFPAVERVVYSTCSIHKQENEDVVQKVLEEHGERFVLEPVLEDLPSRGQGKFRGSEHCLRLSPSSDHTNGFFVACFKRRTSRGEGESVLLSSSAETELAVGSSVDVLEAIATLKKNSDKSEKISSVAEGGLAGSKNKKKKRKTTQKLLDETKTVIETKGLEDTADRGVKRCAEDKQAEVTGKKRKAAVQPSAVKVTKKQKKQKKKKIKAVTA